MSGTGNDGLDLNLHNNVDKKNFYGLVKKKQVAEQAQEQQQVAQASVQHQAPALTTPPEEKQTNELFKINDMPEKEPEVKSPEPAIDSMDIIDKRTTRLFGDAAEPQNMAGMTRKTFAGNPAATPRESNIR